MRRPAAPRGEEKSAEGQVKGGALLERQRRKDVERRSQKLAREIAALESRIAALEASQKERSALLADPDVYADRERSAPLLTEFREAQAEIERLTTRWENAHAEHERAQGELSEA